MTSNASAVVFSRFAVGYVVGGGSLRLIVLGALGFEAAGVSLRPAWAASEAMARSNVLPNAS
jgi:hypothetical protein